MTDGRQSLLPIDRFLWTLEIVRREGRHLSYSWRSLFESGTSLDSDWVASLDQCPEEAVRLEAFVSRYSRMQDTIADKLIPRWLQSLAERTGSQIENLNRAERLRCLSRLLEPGIRRLLIADRVEPAGLPGPGSA
ncbi:hypothetical protein BDK63_003324, partial [Halomonas campaniensis]